MPLKTRYLDKELWDLRTVETRRSRGVTRCAVQGEEEGAEEEVDQVGTDSMGRGEQNADGDEEDDSGDDYVDEESKEASEEDSELEDGEKEDGEEEEEGEIDELGVSDDEVDAGGRTKGKVTGRRYRQRDMFRSLDGSALLAIGEPPWMSYSVSAVAYKMQDF